jgi:hypothetical protein
MPTAQAKPPVLLVKHLRALIEKVGVTGACKKTRLARVTVMTIAAGYPVRAGSIAQLTAMLK